MRRLKRNRKGQFVVIAALIIAALTLGLALSIHQINLNRQQLRYEPVEELVLGITSDLDRCLTYALRTASQNYSGSMDKKVPETQRKHMAETVGSEFISKWVLSVLAAYSHIGVKMNINQAGKGLTDVDWNFDWDSPMGFSQVYAKFDLDIDAYGFKGWVGRSQKYVALSIKDLITSGGQTAKLEFRIWQGKDEDEPVPNLTPGSLTVWIYLTNGGRVYAFIENLNYLGGGRYSLTFKGTISQYVRGVRLLVETPGDKIHVSALYPVYSNENIFVDLQSIEENLNSINLGRIQLGGNIYKLPNSTSRLGTILRYFPEEGYSFVNWTITGLATVGNPYADTTNVTIYGNSTITAFYRKISNEPTMVELILDSREKDNLTQHLGIIIFNQTSHLTLPAKIFIPKGTYSIKYLPHNESYVFQQWNFTGNVYPWNASSADTYITVYGNSTVTAIYGTEQAITTSLSVNLQSLEINSASENLGQIQLGDNLFQRLPGSATVSNGTYMLGYIPAEGYSFVNWTATEGISVKDPYSPMTMVTINKNGTITAFYKGYKGCKIILDSKAWDGSSKSLGKITLGQTTYALPKEVTGLPTGDYRLKYLPRNESYFFMWWEYSGNVYPWNDSADTNVTVLGDGTIIAVYGLKGMPPPFVGDWSTLYVDAGYKIVPPFMWSNKSSHLPSRYSTGEGKQIANCTSPLTPELYLARYVNVTAYLRINPPSNAKDVTLELGFKYKGEYYLLGKESFPVKEATGPYFMTIDIYYGQFPGGYYGVIPEGSEIILTVTVTFFKQPWGTLFLYYGPRNPSQINLF